ncbi:MAG: MFS transporter [Gemmatimonadota bacterium]
MPAGDISLPNAKLIPGAPAAGPRNPFRVLASRPNFRRFWIGQTLSLVGTWMQSMSIGWLALELSGSAFVVGLVSAGSALPILLLSLHAGAWVDRSDKLRLVTAAQLLLLIEALLLWWFTWTGRLNVPLLLVLAIMGGVIVSMEIPARQSLMIDLVGRDDLRDAIALNSSGFNLARIVGPALGAAIIARFGIAWCFAVNAASYLTVLIGLRLIELPAPAAPRAPASEARGAREAVAYVSSDSRLRGLVAVITVCAVLCTPTLALLPVIAREQLGLGASGYGLLLSAVGLGGLAGALALAASSPLLPRGRLLAGTQYLCAVLMLLLAMTRQPLVAYLLLLGTGFGLIVNSALGNTIMQSLVPDALRGRMMAVYSIIVIGLPQVVGAFAVGALARQIGISWAVGGSAALMFVYAVWAFRRYPELSRL